jgi:hypothetical protein
VGNKIPSLIPVVSIEFATELGDLADEIFSTTFVKDLVFRGSFGLKFSMGGFLFSIISNSGLAFKFKEFSFMTGLTEEIGDEYWEIIFVSESGEDSEI